MISDFSGVIYDYAFVFDGALIYTEIDFDKSPYDADWLDEPIWAEEILPKIGRKLDRKDIGNMRSVIEKTINSLEYKDARNELKQEVWMFRGEAAVRTVDYLVGKVSEISDSKRESD